MSVDPRRSAVALWLAWVLAGALGQGLVSLIQAGGMGAWLANADELSLLAYGMTLVAIATMFQYVVLLRVATRRWLTLLWLPTTIAGYQLYLQLERLWFTVLPGISGSFDPTAIPDITYPLALGVTQGILLMLMIRRWTAMVLWVAGNLVGLIAADYLGGFVSIDPHAPGVGLVASSMIWAGAYAAATGIALGVILRMRRRAVAPPLPAAVPTLQGQG